MRFNSGGSGSFVSSDGLVLTNHHVGADALQKLSTADRDLVKLGFLARTREEEIKCVDLELNVLMHIEDVTDRVNAAVPPGSPPAEAFKARRAVMNNIEKEALDKTGLRSDVITLYQGGQYHLYQFKKYTDVRLVFAPEVDIAFFGGDPDNFEYPRYDLDICLFHVYENGQPLKPGDFLRWSDAGAADGELTFVAGHPGRSDRLNTVAHLELLRDKTFPYMLNRVRRRELLLSVYSQRGLENARRAKEELFMYQNTRKARLGGLAGLQDPAVMKHKQAEEDALREAIHRDPKLRDAAKAWDEIDSSLRVWTRIYRNYDLLEQGSAAYSHLFLIARGLLRMAEETHKPNAERLREYRESNLDSLKQVLFSPAPIYDDLEILKLGDSLGMFMELAGAEDPLVREALAGQSPPERAAALVQGSTLRDVAVRKKLAAGGLAAINASTDPMLSLARLLDQPAREVRKTFEEKVEEPQRQAYAKLANARFALYGTKVYPDATFTLRLAFGRVLGYEEAGRQFPPWTDIGGAFRHAASVHGSVDPFALPPSWLAAKDRLTLSTPMNFVSTADIIGGNSGSPVVNRKGEFVGIIFDGNLESLVWDFIYTSSRAGPGRAFHSPSAKRSARSTMPTPWPTSWAGEERAMSFEQ